MGANASREDNIKPKCQVLHAEPSGFEGSELLRQRFLRGNCCGNKKVNDEVAKENTLHHRKTKKSEKSVLLIAYCITYFPSQHLSVHLYLTLLHFNLTLLCSTTSLSCSTALYYTSFYHVHLYLCCTGHQHQHIIDLFLYAIIQLHYTYSSLLIQYINPVSS